VLLVLREAARLVGVGLLALALTPGALAQGTPDAPAAPEGVGDTTFSALLGYYNHDDGQGDGNPFLDEELQDLEVVLIYDSNVNQDWGYSLTLSYDRVSSASIERLSQFPAQSGATGDNYIGVDYASRHRIDQDRWWSWSLGASVEYDYLSTRFGGSYSLDAPDRNSKDTFSLTGFYDIVDIIRFNGDSSEGTDNRISLAGTWSHDAVLGPEWNSNTATTLSVQTGFLETAYNAVVLEDPSLPPNPFLFNEANGIEVNEELPDTRLRLSVSHRARRYLGPGRALELGGRLYGDDWGIFSFAFEPRYYFPVVGDTLTGRLRYRYYNQTAAADFEKSFLGLVPTDAPEFRTQDSDLGDFDSHGLGLRFDLNPRTRSRWYFDLNYVLRSDGLDHYFAGLGYSLSF
jgi:hypothetical protein